MQRTGIHIDRAGVVQRNPYAMTASGSLVQDAVIDERVGAAVIRKRCGVGAAQVDRAAHCVGQRVGGGGAKKLNEVISTHCQRALVGPALVAGNAEIAVRRCHAYRGRALRGERPRSLQYAVARNTHRAADGHITRAAQRAAAKV